MPNRVRRAWIATVSAALASGLGLSGGAAGAQQVSTDTPPMYGADGSFGAQLLGGMHKPAVAKQGDWAEVIMANPRWMVIQNAKGQQFPVAFDTVRQFVIRWPTRVDLLATDAFLEVTGPDLGSNQIQADHIDVYEGSARTLVSPTMLRLFGNNRVLTPIDVDQAQTYGAVFPFANDEAGVPPRMHVVGTVVGVNPIRLTIDGNNWATLVPSENGLTMTQITVGTPSYVKKGDFVYYTPDAAGPKALVVSRLILYKTMPLTAFNPAAN